MATHDPVKNASDLREHLSHDDRQIVFLFGAGTSCAVKQEAAADCQEGEPVVPALTELTQKCAEAVTGLGAKFENCWKTIEAECLPAKQEPNIEDILSRVRLKVEAIGSDKTLAGLGKEELDQLEDCIKRTIATLANPGDECIPTDLPHQILARWIIRITRDFPIEIFTTNYDVLFERSLEAERCPFYDGFVGSVEPFFEISDATLPGWTRVWKLHGSINWAARDGDRPRIVRVEPNNSGEMILPSDRKYDESRKQPYIGLLDRLGRVLSRDNSIMVCVGYGFGDEHINNVLFDSIDRPKRNHLFALLHSDPRDDSDLIERATRQPKISVFAPSTAVISGDRGGWKLVEPIDNAKAPFMDLAFDSDATEEEENELSLTGQMKLGDFRNFCDFLRSLQGSLWEPKNPH